MCFRGRVISKNNSFGLMRNSRREIFTLIYWLWRRRIEPSRTSFPEFYNGKRTTDEAANFVRGVLLAKTIDGIETELWEVVNKSGVFRLFFSQPAWSRGRKKLRSVCFVILWTNDCNLEDVEAEITTQLPELLEERPPKPQRVIASITALTRTLKNYEIAFIDASTKSESKKHGSSNWN